VKSNSRLSTLRSSTMPCFRTTTYPFSSLVRSSRYTDALIFSTHKCICYQTQQPLHGFWASQEHIAYVSYIKWETHSFAHMMIRKSEMDGAKLEVLYILFLFHCVLSKIRRFVDFLIVSLCIDHLWAMMLFNWWVVFVCPIFGSNLKYWEFSMWRFYSQIYCKAHKHNSSIDYGHWFDPFLLI